MAALHAAATTSLNDRYRRPTFGTLHSRKPNWLICCYSTPFPSKRTRRKNYLREKILKTLEKPIIPKLPPDPSIPIDSSPLQEIEEPEIADSSEAGNEEVENLEELREAEVAMPAELTLDGDIGKLARDEILKYGLWFLGAFVLQTVVSMLFFDLADTDGKNETSNETDINSVLSLNGKGNGKMGIGSNDIGSVMCVDELEMERKIEEIRAMAREAREKERLESKKDSVGSEDTDVGKDMKSEIEEEVDNRLIRLQKNLEKRRDKKPVAPKRNDKVKNEVEKGELDEKRSNGTLVFKKKYKFKELSSDPVEKPKGFVGSDDNVVGSWNLEEDGENGAISLGGDGNQTEVSNFLVMDGDKRKDVSEMSESLKNMPKKVVKEKTTRKQGNGKGVAKPKSISANPKKVSKGNGSLRGKGFGNARSTAENGSENGSWWSNLPYVLVIFMQRSDNGEVHEGLYTLNRTEDQTSYIVAFEDQGDATNYCYLLQSFFQELRDFSADVVPVTVKELKEAVKSPTMRVIVVKRGQLQLYAGQPLDDAELALRGMIQQV